MINVLEMRSDAETDEEEMEAGMSDSGFAVCHHDVHKE
jgi:hypothetical protein